MHLFEQKVIEKIGTQLIKKEETIAVAESVTSGLLQLALSQAMNAACFYQGGITAYNLGQKYKHLHVEPIHASSVNCVSEKVAREMALHVCQLYSSDWGIGVTGYASPVPESGNKVFAFYSITHRGKVKVTGKISPRQPEDPFLIQLKYCTYILQKLSVLTR